MPPQFPQLGGVAPFNRQFLFIHALHRQRSTAYRRCLMRLALSHLVMPDGENLAEGARGLNPPAGAPTISRALPAMLGVYGLRGRTRVLVLVFRLPERLHSSVAGIYQMHGKWPARLILKTAVGGEAINLAGQAETNDRVAYAARTTINQKPCAQRTLSVK